MSLLPLVLLMQLAMPDPEAVARSVAEDLAARRYAAVTARFGPQMAAALSEEMLRSVWSGLTAQAGEYRGLGTPRRDAVPGGTLVVVPVRYAKQAFGLRIGVGPDGKLIGLRVVPAEETAPWSAPAYADAKAFTEVEVTVGKEWPLPATLTLPKRKEGERVPAVVLVHGSGPHDRDETIGPNRPFADLAQGLASRGVAVLRYEKRTKAFPERCAGLANLTVKDEVTDDARAAVALLRARPEVDPKRVVVVGHSLGATLAPRIAKEEPSLAGIALLAPAARPLQELMVEQTEYLASLSGPPDEATKAKLAEIKAGASRVATAKAGDPPLLGAPAAYWADLNAYDPVATAKALALPILIVQGGRDYQVTAKDLALFRAALAGKPNVTVREMPNLNHLFQPGEGKGTPAEYDRAAHVAPEVVEAVASFVAGITSGR